MTLTSYFETPCSTILLPTHLVIHFSDIQRNNQLKCLQRALVMLHETSVVPLSSLLQVQGFLEILCFHVSHTVRRLTMHVVAVKTGVENKSRYIGH